MSRIFRLIGSVAGAGFILAISGTWLLGRVHADLDIIAREMERSQELDTQLYRSQERVEPLDRLVKELTDCEHSLSEAVQQSRELHQGDDAAIHHLRNAVGGESDDEVLCRHLLVRTASSLSDIPERRAEVMSRLEADFALRHPLAKSPVVNEEDFPMLFRPMVPPETRSYERLNDATRSRF